MNRHLRNGSLPGKAGRPKEALTIYVHVLDDLEAARAYCKETGAWQYLVELLVQPPDQVLAWLSPRGDVSSLQDTLPGLNLEPGKVRPPDLDTAVAVLEAHGDQVTIANISSLSNIGQGKVN